MPPNVVLNHKSVRVRTNTVYKSSSFLPYGLCLLDLSRTMCKVWGREGGWGCVAEGSYWGGGMSMMEGCVLMVSFDKAVALAFTVVVQGGRGGCSVVVSSCDFLFCVILVWDGLESEK